MTNLALEAIVLPILWNRVMRNQPNYGDTPARHKQRLFSDQDLYRSSASGWVLKPEKSARPRYSPKSQSAACRLDEKGRSDLHFRLRAVRPS
jgi:hypothetical protein